MINIDDRLIKEVSPKIRPNALSVLLAIAIHLNQKTNRCFPSIRRLMDLTGMGEKAVYIALRCLRENGLLTMFQPIDSKTKKFGRREFKVSTRFIKIFVDAEDTAPLPENRLAENRLAESGEAGNRLPENRQTYQLNNKEQINEVEQINNYDEAAENPFTLKAEKEKPIPPVAPAPLSAPPAGGYRPLNIETEIERLENDDLVKESFRRRVKLPIEAFGVYVKDFSLHVQTLQKTYSNVTEFRSHFFNYCDTHKRKQADTPKPPTPGLPRDMVNLNAL